MEEILVNNVIEINLIALWAMTANSPMLVSFSRLVKKLPGSDGAVREYTTIRSFICSISAINQYEKMIRFILDYTTSSRKMPNARLETEYIDKCSVYLTTVFLTSPHLDGECLHCFC